jgi:hypothetical protein
MNGHEQEIASALREMAGQAATPPPRIEAAWRAGRRRRRNAMTASVAGAAGVTAAAVLVPMAVTGGSVPAGNGAAGHGKAPKSCVARPGAALAEKAASSASASAAAPCARITMVPVSPSPRVQFKEVASVVHKPCPKGSHGVPALSGHACYYLTGKGMTATIARAELVRLPGSTTAQGKPAYMVQITLARSDAAPYKVLTSRLQHLPAPHNELAWIANGKVVTSPAVQGPIPATFQIAGPNGMSAQAQQQFLVELEGAGKPVYATPDTSQSSSGSGKVTGKPAVPQVRLRQVAKVVDKPCPPGSHGVPGLSGSVCYYLTSKGMAAGIESAKVVRIPGKTAQGRPVYGVGITLVPGETGPLNALISQLIHQAVPHNELAWIAGGKVVTSPAVEGKLPATFQLTAPSGSTARDQKQFIKELTAGH